MLYNYVLTAWKVFLRRKFFTFINLFGISLTLAVLMIATSMVEGYLYPKGPEKTSANYKVIDRLTLTNEKHTSTYGGRLGFKFIKENIWRLTSPEIISLNSGASSVALYQNNQKMPKSFRRTDANYWKILDFKFIEGRAFDHGEVEQGQFVAVINQKLATELFGQSSAIGKSLDFNNQRFQIIGVTENVSEIERNATADIWTPYTTMPSTSYQQDYQGSWEVIVYHSDPSMLDEIQKEYINMLKNDLVLDHQDGMSVAYSGAFNKFENIAYQAFSDEYSYKSGTKTLATVLIVLVVVFMLLPSINMINLNVSRIMERSSEIGVRKAFGASASQLVAQFIVESILITLVGGLIGILISVFLLNLIEQSGLIAFAEFGMNLRVLFIGFVLILVFGFISGAYPALKMSRLNPVSALKGGE